MFRFNVSILEIFASFGHVEKDSLRFQGQTSTAGTGGTKATHIYIYMYIYTYTYIYASHNDGDTF